MKIILDKCTVQLDLKFENSFKTCWHDNLIFNSIGRYAVMPLCLLSFFDVKHRGLVQSMLNISQTWFITTMIYFFHNSKIIADYFRNLGRVWNILTRFLFSLFIADTPRTITCFRNTSPAQLGGAWKSVAYSGWLLLSRDFCETWWF